MMRNKGQLSMVNIISWVLLVAIGAIVTPLLAEFATIAADGANSTMGSIIAMAIVPFFWLGVVITFFIFVMPIRSQQ